MKKTIIIIEVFLLAFTFTACGSQATPTSGPSASDIYTSIVQTLTAQPTQIQGTQTPIPTETTVVQDTATPEKLATDEPPVVVTVGCDNSVYVSDVTIPDGTTLAPGATFTKTWRLTNTGSCSWSNSYEMAFVSGSVMSGVSTMLKSSVSSNANGDVSVAMTAPKSAGTYTGYWKLKNASGGWFGQSVYVKIVVSGGTQTVTPTPTETIEGGKTSTPTTTAQVTLTRTKTPIIVPTAIHTKTFTAEPTNTATAVVVPTDVPEPSATPSS